MKPATHFTVLLCIGLMVSACKPKCTFRDGVDILDHQKDLYLVLRSAGIQEKVFTYELYRGKPAFDSCSKPAVQPVSSEIYEDYEGQLRAVDAHTGRIRFVYAKKHSEAVDLYDVRLTR